MMNRIASQLALAICLAVMAGCSDSLEHLTVALRTSRGVGWLGSSPQG